MGASKFFWAETLTMLILLIYIINFRVMLLAHGTFLAFIGLGGTVFCSAGTFIFIRLLFKNIRTYKSQPIEQARAPRPRMGFWKKVNMVFFTPFFIFVIFGGFISMPNDHPIAWMGLSFGTALLFFHLNEIFNSINNNQGSTKLSMVQETSAKKTIKNGGNEEALATIKHSGQSSIKKEVSKPETSTKKYQISMEQASSKQQKISKEPRSK